MTPRPTESSGAPSSLRPCLFLAVLLAFSFAPRALAEPVDLAKSLANGEPVRVDVAYGRLRVVAGAQGTIRVRGEIDEQLRGVTVRREAGAMEVRVRYPFWSRARSLWRNEPRYRADLTIEVPAPTPLFLVSRDATVEIEGLTGPLGIGVVSSEVEIRADPSRLDVETVSGSLVFDGESARVRASTMSGELRLARLTGEARLDSVTGAVVAGLGGGRRLEVETVSGDIEVDGSAAENAELSIESHSGSVTLGGVAVASLDVETRHGEIVSELDAQPIRSDDGRRRLVAAAGQQGAMVRVKTRSGLIRLLAPDGR